MLDSTLNKVNFHLAHQVDFLLAHGFTQGVRLTAGKSAPFLRYLHELLLIDKDAVGILQRIFHTRVKISDILLTMFSLDKRIDKLHRPRPVQRHHGDDVVKHRRLQVAKIALHARRLQLKHARRVTALKQLIRLLVIKW